MNAPQNQSKAPPSAELSLKFIAWDIKQINQSLQRLVELLAENSANKSIKNNDDIPF